MSKLKSILMYSIIIRNYMLQTNDQFINNHQNFMNITDKQIIDIVRELEISPSKLKSFILQLKNRQEDPQQQSFQKSQKLEGDNKNMSKNGQSQEILPDQVEESSLQFLSDEYYADDYDWNEQILLFFQTLEQLRIPKNHNQLREHLEDAKEFLQFNSNFLGVYKVRFCVIFFSFVSKQGGFLHVLGKNKLSQVVEQLKKIIRIPKSVQCSTKMCFQLYKKYILAYEMRSAGFLKIIRPVDIDQVRYFSPKELDHIIKNKQQGIEFDRDIFVLQNIAQYVGFDYNILNPSYLVEHYGDIVIDTRIQRSNAFGFEVFEEKLFTQSYSMKIRDYVQYQQLEGTSAIKKLPIAKELKPGLVCFGVNIDLFQKTDIERQIHTKLEKVKFVQYLNELDALSYCQNLIAGCNLPQVYLKVKGVFTGGHQENAAMASVNINFGPDDSQWFTLAIDHVDRLRKQVISEFKIDIIDSQGLWFATPQWMISNNYPIKKIIQKKGDLVYSAPGTLHWVRSMGKCYQVAWNVFPKTQKQWKQSLVRTQINLQIKFYQIFMPLKSLAIKILNHEYHTQTPFMKAIKKSLYQWLQQEQTLVKSYNQKNPSYPIKPSYRRLSDNQSLCEKCRYEVMTIYHLSDQGFTTCLKCCLQKTSEKKRIFYKKHNSEDIKYLFSRIKDLKKMKSLHQVFEIKPLCSEKYCGVVNCSKKNQNEEVMLVGKVTMGKSESREKSFLEAVAFSSSESEDQDVCLKISKNSSIQKPAQTNQRKMIHKDPCVVRRAQNKQKPKKIVVMPPQISRPRGRPSSKKHKQEEQIKNKAKPVRKEKSDKQSDSDNDDDQQFYSKVLISEKRIKPNNDSFQQQKKKDKQQTDEGKRKRAESSRTQNIRYETHSVTEPNNVKRKQFSTTNSAQEDDYNQYLDRSNLESIHNRFSDIEYFTKK